MFDPPGVEDLWGYNPIFGQPVATPAGDGQELEPTSVIETTNTNFSNDDDSALLDQLIQGPTCSIFGNLFESGAAEEFSYHNFPYQPLVTSFNGNMADQPDHFTNYEMLDFSAATHQQLQYQPCPDSSTGPAPELANLSMIETGKAIESNERTACDLDLNQDEVTSSTSFQPTSSMNIFNSPSTMTNGSGCLTPTRLSGKNTTIFAKKSPVKLNPASKVSNFKNQKGIIGQQAQQQDEQVLHTCQICRREFARYKNLIRHELNFHGRINEEEKVVHAPLVVQNSAKPTMIKNKVKMKGKLRAKIKIASHQEKHRFPSKASRKIDYSYLTRKEYQPRIVLDRLEITSPYQPSQPHKVRKLEKAAAKSLAKKRKYEVARNYIEGLPTVKCGLCDRVLKNKYVLHQHRQQVHGQDSSRARSSQSVGPTAASRSVIGLKRSPTISLPPLVEESDKSDEVSSLGTNPNTPSSPVLESDEESPAVGPTSTDEEVMMSSLKTKCTICHRSYSKPANLHRHQITMHNLQENGWKYLLQEQVWRYECKNCSQIVPYKQLKTHQISVHNTNVKIYANYSRVRQKMKRYSGTYECNICHKKLCSSAILHEHQVRIHNVQLEGHPFLWKCNICNKVMSYSNRYKHLKTVHRISGLGSTIKKHFTLVTAPHHSLTSQTTSENLQNSTECIICHEKFVSKKDFQLHQIRVHNFRPSGSRAILHSSSYQCNLCHAKFSYSNIGDHLSVAHQIRTKYFGRFSTLLASNGNCGGDELSSESTETENNSKSSALEELECKICDKKFDSNYSLRLHQILIHQLRPKGYKTITYNVNSVYQCNLCRTVIKYSNLKDHLLSAHQTRSRYLKQFSTFVGPPGVSDARVNNLVCDLSSKMKSVSSSNSSKKNFECKICHRNYTSVRFLRQHEVLVHDKSQSPPHGTTAGAFECNVCHKNFSRSQTLRHHKILIHKLQLNGYERVIRSARERKSCYYQCNICQEILQNDHLGRHLSVQHKVKMKPSTQSQYGTLVTLAQNDSRNNDQDQQADLSSSGKEYQESDSEMDSEFSDNSMSATSTTTTATTSTTTTTTATTASLKAKYRDRSNVRSRGRLQCNICSRKFAQDYSLRRHQVLIHKLRPFGYKAIIQYNKSFAKCNICHAILKLKNIRTHLLNSHKIKGRRVFRRYCTFVGAPDASNHEETSHGKPSDSQAKVGLRAKGQSHQLGVLRRPQRAQRKLKRSNWTKRKTRMVKHPSSTTAGKQRVVDLVQEQESKEAMPSANHKQDHLDIVQNPCVGDVDVSIVSLPDKIISPKTPNSSPVKKSPSPRSSPRKELNPPTPTPSSPRKKSKQGDWLRRKLKAHKLILSIYAKLLTERCQVKLFDIGFLVDGARATGDEQPTFIVKPLPREEVGNSSAPEPEAEEDDHNDDMDIQEGQDQQEQILETALKEDKEMQEIDYLEYQECEDQQEQSLEAAPAPVEEEPKKVQEEIDDMETHDGEDQQELEQILEAAPAPVEEEPKKVQEEIDDMETHDGEDQQELEQILEAAPAPVEEEPKEVQEILNDLLDKIGEMEMDEISGQESSLSKKEEDVKANKEEARYLTLYKINGKNVKKTKKTGVDPIKSSCSIDLNEVSPLIPFELISISSTGFYSTVCFINEDTEESPTLDSLEEPTPISVSPAEAEGEVEVSNACCDLDDKRKAEPTPTPTPTQPVKKIKSNTNAKLRQLRVKAEDDAMRFTKCGICKSEVPIIELSTHKIEHEIQCHICLKHLRLSEIRKHGISHIVSKVCEICNLPFKSRGALWEHANIHFEVKPIICNYCGIGFVSRKDLVNHSIVKHTNIAALACQEASEDEEPEMP